MRRNKTRHKTESEHSWSGERLSLVAVLANPEEEAFGPAGTLAKYASEGLLVSLVTAAREGGGHESTLPNMIPLRPARAEEPAAGIGPARRDVVCSCRTTGVRRICLPEVKVNPGEMPDRLQERLVRIFREMHPHVVVTYGPPQSLGVEQARLSEAVTRAFCAAGDPRAFPHHLADGLIPYQPRKLYYAVLPNSLLERWGVTEIQGVPDVQITTVLDVSDFAESKLKAIYCNRNHVLDYVGWLSLEKGATWDKEYFLLAESTLGHKSKREHDLFAGLR